MTAPTIAPGTSGQSVNGPETFEAVACPFCGILCDDLAVARFEGALKITRNGCPKAVAGFERKLPAARPMVAGHPVALEDAVTKAAALLRASRLPLFGGLATDVEGIRGLMALADRAGAVVGHALSTAQYRNYRVLQSTGWVTTTLTEVRNRADLIIIVGTDAHALHPRFFERIVSAEETMFPELAGKRTVVFIGKGLDASPAVGPRIKGVVKIDCENDRVGEVIAALRSRLKGHPVPSASVAGVPLAAIDDLVNRCHNADYGVFIWAPPSLDYPNADLTVQAICDTIRDMTPTQRFAGLSLGGDEGATSAAAVCSWQSGYPLRVSFASGKPHYDPERYSIPKMLAAGEGDLLLWTASITPDIAVPDTMLPLIVLGTPGLALPRQPDVFIPVGTAGVDHSGRMIRVDSVVTLPLKDLKRSSLPSVAAVAQAMLAALAL